MRTRKSIHQSPPVDSRSAADAVAARQGAPVRAPRIPATAVLLLGLLALPEAGLAGTGRLLSQWMSRAPRIDGRIEGAEWAAAKPIDLGSGVTVRIGNDQRTLYLAVLDAGDATYDAGDDFRLHFDDEGSVPPVLDDGMFGNPACQGAPNLGEGRIGFLGDVYFNEATQTGWCPTTPVITDRVSFHAAARPEGVTYEAAIPLDGPAPLLASPGERFGLWLQVKRYYNEVACLPNCAATSPPDFQNLILASGGCNTGPQTFGSGDPQTGLPLDWTSEVTYGGGQGWIQSQPPYYGTATRCRSNETGGSGAAACVANLYYTAPHSVSSLRMPLSLAGYTSVEVRLRALLVIDPTPNGQGDLLTADYRRADGTTDYTDLFWLGQDQSGVVSLPLLMGASLPAELWFTHGTFAAGGVQGGYAQIDDVELLCDPLFVDDFESGDTSAW